MHGNPLLNKIYFCCFLLISPLYIYSYILCLFLIFLIEKSASFNICHFSLIVVISLKCLFSQPMFIWGYQSLVFMFRKLQRPGPGLCLFLNLRRDEDVAATYFFCRLTTACNSREGHSHK